MTDCGVRLLQQHSATQACTLGVTFGCNSQRQMWVSTGCRGRFQCGGRAVNCASHHLNAPRVNCSCVACSGDRSSSRGGDDATILPGVHCCADNGATLRFGSWAREEHGNSDTKACREWCTGTPSCTHYAYSDAPDECADEMRASQHAPGRCMLCAACTQRHRQPQWQSSFTSFALAVPPPTTVPAAMPGRLRHPRSSGARFSGARSSGARATVASYVPTLILSGCDWRYERAAAEARRALLSPSWMPGIFSHNIGRSSHACRWPTAGETRLLAAHRNAWSVIASSNRSMLVLEDDVEFVSSAAHLHADIRRCDERATCELLFIGCVDAFWATHALYISPRGARELLRRSAGRCAEPTDYHTHRMCMLSGDFGQNDHRLSPRCAEPSESQHADAGRLRAPELYGYGHFVQNRTIGLYLHSQNIQTGHFGAGHAFVANGAEPVVAGQGNSC